MYVNKGLSQQVCGEILGCSQTKIGMVLKEYGIPIKPFGSWTISKKEIPMTDEMYEILRGALLGDGSLIIPKNGKNARFTYSSKSLQHVEYVTKMFSEWCSENGILYRKRYDKRTDKYYDNYSYQSITTKTFTDEYHKWYIGGAKHIPNDLILTPLMCKIWYLGDGSLINSRGITTRIALYTNCFDKEELEKIIMPQLNEFELKLQKMGIRKDGKEAYVIVICKHENIQKFLDYIGDSPFDDYNYKWNIIESKLKDYAQYKDEWKTLNYYGVTNKIIADMYGCSDSTIKKYLNEIGIKKTISRDEYKKWIIMYNNGYNSNDISNILKCNQQAVDKYLKYYNDNNINVNLKSKIGVSKNYKRWIVYYPEKRKIKYFDDYEEAVKERNEYEIELYNKYNYKALEYNDGEINK